MQLKFIARLSRALFEAGIPQNALITSDIQREYARLKGRGVVFRGEPQAMGPITFVAFAFVTVVALFAESCHWCDAYSAR